MFCRIAGSFFSDLDRRGAIKRRRLVADLRTNAKSADCTIFAPSRHLCFWARKFYSVCVFYCVISLYLKRRERDRAWEKLFFWEAVIFVVVIIFHEKDYCGHPIKKSCAILEYLELLVVYKLLRNYCISAGHLDGGQGEWYGHYYYWRSRTSISVHLDNWKSNFVCWLNVMLIIFLRYSCMTVLVRRY